jgi:hypothetical protein
VSELADEIAQLLDGATDKLDGAAEIIGYAGCSSRAADLAYNGVGDALNLATKAYLRSRGQVGLRERPAKSLLQDVMRQLHRSGVRPLPDEDALATIIDERNGSVHEGAASASELATVAEAIAVVREYVALIRRYP